MSKSQTFTAIFEGATRRNGSVNGNPTWTLHTSEGDYRTQSDAALGYEVSNHTHSRHGLVGQLVTFTATLAGRVWNMEPVVCVNCETPIMIMVDGDPGDPTITHNTPDNRGRDCFPGCAPEDRCVASI